MKTDRTYKLLLSAMTVLLCANLLIALKARPIQAQPSRSDHPHYRVISPGDTLEKDAATIMNKWANDGYRFKGMAGDRNGVYIVMEK